MKQVKVDDNKVQGEGDYDAARNYDEATRDFVKSGKVEQAARDAAPANAAEAAELARAEQAGKSRSKGESTGSPTDEPAGAGPEARRP
ncbi:hypothetical protein [Methylibium sp.]|uniref:hypothetical protein n=1 Tax=Methylibium sp. TaxID=2067992 RepID=UPI00286AE7DF|nr:hypothetical protein [Methylibium sp.]